MDRETAITQLRGLVGLDIHELALQLEVNVRGSAGQVNKGWAGHVVERYLGLPQNSAQAPNFGSWELKVIPLKRTASGSLAFKETMAITMIDPWQVSRTPFESSHLLLKLRRAVVVAREVGKTVDDTQIVHSVSALDLSDEVYMVVKRDYEAVQRVLQTDGIGGLSGRMGTYVQPRTKGPGHGSTSRAFYARPNFLALYVDLKG